MAYDPDLLERMRTVMQGREGITERKMFGGYMWMLNGNMLCGVGVGRFMFRVGKEQEEEALSRPGAAPMDITRRPMGGFVWVDAEAVLGDGLDDWIGFASRFVGALPAK